MSNRKKGRREDRSTEMKKEMPIENDPYWKVSNLHMDVHRVGRFVDKFEQLEDEHPEWTDELLDGTPSFYCVLGVPRGAGKDEVREAFDMKSKFSSYPGYILDEAFEVLNDPELQKKYDELVFVFEHFTKCMPPRIKNELIYKHDLCKRIEKEFNK
jgi:hypothetical protein